ncbi:hypothetical protein F53441_8096 [Fusarium austroafricanum]|uniref:F-box domain-containing protein n=1 Tax=Fusarium austroafricanum TaxID=2364996 RepID=A0A8H4KC24_9HYPO|nr:hypothetical protein F53441_8096 [Fusarium austroafricanum]
MSSPEHNGAVLIKVICEIMISAELFKCTQCRLKQDPGSTICTTRDCNGILNIFTYATQRQLADDLHTAALEHGRKYGFPRLRHERHVLATLVTFKNEVNRMVNLQPIPNPYRIIRRFDLDDVLPTMAFVQSQPPPLERLPREILLHGILPRLLFSPGSSLAGSSRCLYQLLIQQLYRLSGTHLNWYPLFHAAHTNNIATLQRCLEVGAPLNFRWPIRGDVMRHVYIRPSSPPLRKAIFEYQVGCPVAAYSWSRSKRWIRQQGAGHYLRFSPRKWLVCFRSPDDVARPH